MIRKYFVLLSALFLFFALKLPAQSGAGLVYISGGSLPWAARPAGAEEENMNTEKSGWRSERSPRRACYAFLA